MVHLLHTSDTHLGHQQYPRIDPRSGINQREQDHYDVWHRLIDAAIDDPPDVFVHAGDLFDGVRPSNRALAAALEGLVRLDQAGIETVLIAGNHEHPKMRGTGSPFRLFEHLRRIHPVYKGRLETLDVGDARVHAVPQCSDAATLHHEVEAVSTGEGTDVLVIHGAVSDMDAFKHAEFNEQTLDTAWFERFDHVALGHYHNTTQVADNAWYCGAPDRVSISEAGSRKGHLRVEVDGTRRDVHLVDHDVRPYVDLPRVHLEGAGLEDVMAAAQGALEGVPEGAVARLRLDDVDGALRGTLDQHAIRHAAAHALHLDLRINWADVRRDVQAGPELGGLVEEFEAFAAGQPIAGGRRQRLMTMARDLLGDGAR